MEFPWHKTLRERTLTKKTLREREGLEREREKERERDGIAGERPTKEL